MTDYTAMQASIAAVRQQMAAAMQAAGRKDRVLLCAVCKGQPSSKVRASADMAIDLFGENRMQEMQAHHEDGAYADKPCHFIGHLQTNKVRFVVGKAALIQSVGSQRLLAAIAREATKQGIRQDILIQVNIGEEETKSGAAVQELWPLVDAACQLDSLRLRGLMAIPPAFDNSAESRRYFAMMRSLYEQAQHRLQDKAFDTLSLGMTDSFEAAILEGATLIRVGRAIYGERQG